MLGRTNTGGCGVGGVLTVTAPAGVTVSVSKDGKVKTKTANAEGLAVFKGLATGTWQLTITDGSQTSTKPVVITADYSTVIAFFMATIAITYPAGSICTCSDGVTTLTAPNTSGVWNCIVPNTGTWTVTVTDGENTTTKDVDITNDGQTETVTLDYNAIPSFTYTGDYVRKTAADYGLYGDYEVIALLTSGTLEFSREFEADIFLVGGGGGTTDGRWGNQPCGGAGGGYTELFAGIDITQEVVTIGEGGAVGSTGGTTSVGSYSVNGGNPNDGGTGGTGGAKGGDSSQYSGKNGEDGTPAFNENGATPFGGAGGGGTSSQENIGLGGQGGGANGEYGSRNAIAGTTNTGGGAGGHGYNDNAKGAVGGSGIALIRPAQAA